MMDAAMNNMQIRKQAESLADDDIDNGEITPEQRDLAIHRYTRWLYMRQEKNGYRKESVRPDFDFSIS